MSQYQIDLDDILEKSIINYVSGHDTKEEKELNNYFTTITNKKFSKYQTTTTDDKYQLLLEANNHAYKHIDIPKPTYVRDQTIALQKFLGNYNNSV